MEKHFCSCTVKDCPNHPINTKKGCDPCIKKNIELGEIPYCFWLNEVIGQTEYSAEKFAKYHLDKLNTEK